MAEMLNTQKIRAALVFQAVQLGQHLRTALAEAGIEVVAESQANALPSPNFDDSLDVFVVNLDPELEDHLDDVSDLLDRYQRPVIFNDGAASSGLAGWDQARWARHLASKIRGELDSHPPRPKDATFIPERAKPIQPEPLAQKSKQSPVFPAEDLAVLKPQKSMAATVELPKIALPASTIASLSDLGKAVEIDSHSSTLHIEEAPVFDFKEAGFGWVELDAVPSKGDSAEVLTSESVDDVFDLSEFDLALEPMAADAPDEFEALLRTQQNVKPNSAPTIASVEALAPVAPHKADIASEKLKDAPMDWSLEPLDGDDMSATVAPTSGKATFSVKDVVTPVMVARPNVSAVVPMPVSAPDVLEELSDLDFFTEIDDIPVSQAPIPDSTQSHQSLDQLFADLDDISFDANEPMSSALNSSDPALTTNFDDDFDFDMDVEAPPSVPLSNMSAQTREIPVLDARFSTGANASFSAAAESTYKGPSRVYVLGASIGGPEAVKTFLSKLKPGIAAAFVLAQHMGAEFLELMAGQLSKSSVLPVKLAQEGVALLESEVLVVPVNKRFTVDANGLVEFQETFDESPYSPSIDQVMSDMSERFGTRCVGIIFSGMASDAIEGSKVIASRGGKVWVQDPATCVISSMIDGAQAAGIVSYVGAPEQLADHVLEDLGVR